MSRALITTISLLSLIVTGFLLQRKIKTKDQLDGIKTIILSLALPATILIALLQINFESKLIIIPAMSLGFNILMFLLIDKLPFRPFFNIPVNQYRTLIMLMPSLAPGLSCFPFIVEYSGQGPLAMAALADVGNKIFVLIISYTIAMKWYYEVNRAHAERMKIKDMFWAMIQEPVNLVIVVAVIMLSLGLTFSAFPDPMAQSLDRLSLLMTPMILLFIGLSMRLTWQQVRTIFSFLFLRSGTAFAVSGLVLYFFPVTDLPTMLLIVVFPQSACSFWPYAHMVSVGQIENKLPGEGRERTFDQDFAMNILACSMPFSVVLIISIYASGNVFTRIPVVMLGSLLLVGIGVLIIWLSSRLVTAYHNEEVSLPVREESVELSSVSGELYNKG
jgi:hypothetical protein